MYNAFDVVFPPQEDTDIPNEQTSISSAESFWDDPSDDYEIESKRDYYMCNGDGEYMSMHVGTNADGYCFLRKIGRGFYSTVWLTFREESYDLRALKLGRAENEAEIARERKMYQKLLSRADDEYYKRVVHFYHEVEATNPTIEGIVLIHTVFSLELCGKSLEWYANAAKGLTLPVIKKVARQVLEGLVLIHSLDAIHNDLNPANILTTSDANENIALIQEVADSGCSESFGCNIPETEMYDEEDQLLLQDKFYTFIDILKIKYGKKLHKKSSNSLETAEARDPVVVRNKVCRELLKRRNFKIADYGASIHDTKVDITAISQLDYAAPETIFEHELGEGIDIWSLACVLFKLFTNESLFLDTVLPDDHRDEMILLKNMEKALGPLPIDCFYRSKQSYLFLKPNGHTLDMLMFEVRWGIYGFDRLPDFVLPKRRVKKRAHNPMRRGAPKKGPKKKSRRDRTIDYLLQRFSKFDHCKDAKDFAAFLADLLIYDPCFRPNALACLAMPFLAN